MTDHIVQFQAVSKKYPGKTALQDISFTIPRGKVIGLIGPNGSGKSTALKLMSGLLSPTSGTVLVNGEPAGRHSTRHVAYLSDKADLYDFYNVRETFDFYRMIYADFDIEKAQEMARFLRLVGDQKVKSLSKGNLARLKMILAISRRVPLILMDEPLSGLDPMVRETIIRSIISFFNPEQTILLSTHEVSEIEPLLDMVMLIHSGRLVAFEETEAIREQHQQSLVHWMSEAVR